MKKSILLSILMIQSLIVLSQSMGKGLSVLYIGAGAGKGSIGVSQYKGSGYVYRSSPTLHLGFEHGISEAIPESIIGLGGSLSMWFGSQKYSDRNGHQWDKKWTDMTALVKAHYHHKFLTRERWDIYGAILLGIKYRSYTYTSNDEFYLYQNTNETGVYPAGGVGIGGRIYVSDTFGFYAEAGAGNNIDYIQAGIAFKF